MRHVAPGHAGGERVDGTETTTIIRPRMKATTSPPLAPIQRETLHDQVYERVRGALMSAALAPGEVVTIRSLAATLGTSTMPVRDALKRLVAERVLEMLPNRSVRVPLMTLNRMVGLYDIRRTLEGLATERAAELLTRGDLRALERISREMIDAITRQRVDVYLSSHYRFYFTIYKAYSQELVYIIEGLWLQAGPYFQLYFNESGCIKAGPDHLSRLVSALRARDAVAARDLVERDIDEASEYF